MLLSTADSRSAAPCLRKISSARGGVPASEARPDMTSAQSRIWQACPSASSSPAASASAIAWRARRTASAVRPWRWRTAASVATTCDRHAAARSSDAPSSARSARPAQRTARETLPARSAMRACSQSSCAVRTGSAATRRRADVSARSLRSSSPVRRYASASDS